MRWAFLAFVVSVLISCNKSTPPQATEASPDEVKAPPQEVPTKTETKEAALPASVEELIYKHELYNYPELTVLLSVKDSQRTARLVREAGGKITYDPNLSTGHDIGFLIADLPPEKILDKAFVKSLALKAINVDHPAIDKIRVQAANRDLPKEEDLFVPLNDIKVNELRKRPGNTLGKNIVVAVIDTGVDASHYAFQNRIIYWNDMTREGRVPVKTAEVKEGKIQMEKESWAVPAGLDAKKPIYQGAFSEKALSVQFPLSAKLKGEAGLDIDGNGLFDDEFGFLVGSSAGDPSSLLVYVDIDGDKKLSDTESKSPVMDFNSARAFTRNAASFLKAQKPKANAAPGKALLAFPSRNKKREFPLILTADEKGGLQTVAIGIDLEEHGTHVSGIIAGHDGKQVEGAAPEAEIMSLKVCSGLTCTEEAILRGLVEAFYNPQGLVPDVVNISLGSQEGFQERSFNILMRDLAAKFGATFFISASNDGPGYRSLNSIASTGPEVMVGAYVSRNTLMKHYTLDSGINIPEHSLHYFTSVGPSYTGQFRPNIVAPGSAISSIPMSLGRSAMFNGTSMASPIAAGSAAALLGLARTANAAGEIENEEVRIQEARRRSKITAMLNKEEIPEPYSNISVPLSLRTALESSATQMPYYTAAQRGHGLINIDAAYETFISLAKKVNAGEVIFADFKVNNNQKGGLYDRQLPIAGAKSVELSLESDGEAAKETYLLQNEALTISLDEVEVQGTDGSVQSFTGEEALKYFALARRGVEGNPAQTTAIIMVDAAKSAFTSVRRLSTYESGKNYLAHYNVYRSGQRLFSLLDVVHKPLELPNLPINVDIPALDVKKSVRLAALALKDQTIPANTIHRYPIALTQQDGKLSVQLAISSDSAGSVLVQVHDGEGRKVGTAVSTRSPQFPTEERVAKISVDTTKNYGIYEVVVSTAGGRWNGPSKYNLLVEALRFRTSAKKVSLAVGETTSLSYASAPGQVRGISSELGELSRLEQVKVSLMAQRWTFKRIPFPSESEGGSDNLRVEISSSVDDPDSAAFSGDFVPYLFKLKDGKPVIAMEPNRAESILSGDLIFEDVPRKGEPLYFAVETFDNIKDGDTVAKTIDQFTVDIVFPGIEVKTEGKLKAEEPPSATPGLNTVVITAPTEIKNVPVSAKAVPRARATLKITSDVKDIAAEIPVTLVQ